MLRRCWSLCLLLAVVLGWFGLRSSVAFQPDSARAADLIARRPVPTKDLGNASCSAANCHGGFEPATARRIRGDEYKVWLRDDPHSDAFAALSSPLGKQIAERLKLGDATKAVECLACHVNPRFVTKDGVAPKSPDLLTDGVSCEACHGTADRWLSKHSEAAWRTLPWQAKRDQGMSPILSTGPTAENLPPGPPLSERVKVCAGCHVGAPADEKLGLPLRDMNHDMIAAGHPRLNFEYTAYMANIPPHWKKLTPPDGRSWAIGRIVTAKVALDLLADRAANANKPAFLGSSQTRPWPEFAEHDCFACHHDLADPSFRQQRGYGTPQRKAGAFLPNNWYLSDLGEPIEKIPLIKPLKEHLARPAPEPAHVRRAAESLGTVLRTMSEALDSKSLTSEELARRRDMMFKGYEEQPEQFDLQSWDGAAQVYLALMAANGGKPDPVTDRLLEKLRFDPGFDSPRHKFPPFPTKP